MLRFFVYVFYALQFKKRKRYSGLSSFCGDFFLFYRHFEGQTKPTFFVFPCTKETVLVFLKPSHLVLLIKVSSFFHTAAEFTTSAPIYCVIHGLFSDDLLPLSHTSNLEFEIPVQFHREIKASALMW